MRGQAEILIIVGVIVVIGAVAYFALQMTDDGPPITPIENQKRLLTNSIESTITAATLETIDEISTYGGYSGTPPNYVMLNGKEVPYWQYRGQVTKPDVQAAIIQGVTEKLMVSKEALQEGYSQKVTIEDPSVSANILDDKVVLTVNMRSVLWIDEKPYPIDSFNVEVPSRLGETISFAESFISESQNERFFETFTMASILTTPFDGPARKVPFYVFLLGCGESLYKTWYDIKPEMESVIENTLAHTYMPEKYPTDVIRTSSSPKYSLPPLGLNSYKNLDITFHVPDDFELTRSTFQMSPNIISIFAEPIPYTDVCQSEPMVINYYVNYPTIVRVRDDLTGSTFQFAIDVFLKDNKPALWTEGGYDSTYQGYLCTSLQCDADITVYDSGTPVMGAGVSFMGCPVGTTDASGNVQGAVPCGSGPLEIAKAGYEIFSEMRSTSDENEVNQLETVIELARMPSITMFFYEVEVVEQLDGTYRVPYTGIAEAEGTIQMDFTPLESGTVYQPIYTQSSVHTVSHIPVGDYYTSAVVSDEFGLRSAMSTPYTISTTDDKLYVYIPKSADLNDLDDEQALLKIHALSRVLINCGIGPVMTTKYNQLEACVTTA